MWITEEEFIAMCEGRSERPWPHEGTRLAAEAQDILDACPPSCASIIAASRELCPYRWLRRRDRDRSRLRPLLRARELLDAATPGPWDEAERLSGWSPVEDCPADVREVLRGWGS